MSDKIWGRRKWGFSIGAHVRFTIVLLLIILSSYLAGRISVSSSVCDVSCDHHGWMVVHAGQQKQISDRIIPDQIQLFNDRLIVLGEFFLSEYEDTNSMLPLLDVGSTGVYVNVYDDTDLVIGDVVSYRIDGFRQNVVHRIVDIGVDEVGVYFVTKGDNNRLSDPYKVRKSDVRGVLVGILW